MVLGFVPTPSAHEPRSCIECRLTESDDDILTRPLGVPEAKAPEQPMGRSGRLIARLRQPKVAAGAIAAALMLALGLVLALGDPQGGEPRVETAITRREAVSR